MNKTGLSSGALLSPTIKRDAARYRYLRSKESRDHKGCSRRALKFAVVDWAKKLDRHSRSAFWSSQELTGTAMDKAIDKAMRNAAREGK